jgi:hypothetical protein
VISKRCEFEGCKTQPSFGSPDDHICRRCFKHKFEKDEDVVNKRCEFEGCETHSSFGNLNDRIRRRCAKHKLETDEDLVNKKCGFEGCKTRASFGDSNNHRPHRCGKHKLETDEDVVSKRCEFRGCKTRALFGDPNDHRPHRCGKHKLETDEDIVHKKCEFRGCKTRASFGDPDDHRPHRCGKHKLETDDDVVHKKCIKCHIYRVYFDDVCSNCDPILNERKEYKVINFLRSHVNENLHDFVHNRILPNNDGTKYRPDILFNFSDSAIIVEIDEFQHKRYDPILEEERMIKLREILDCNVLFIRFNPDKYWISNVLKNVKLEEKMDDLAETILNYIENPIEESMRIIKLYYDE